MLSRVQLDKQTRSAIICTTHKTLLCTSAKNTSYKSGKICQWVSTKCT